MSFKKRATRTTVAVLDCACLAISRYESSPASRRRATAQRSESARTSLGVQRSAKNASTSPRLLSASRASQRSGRDGLVIVTTCYHVNTSTTRGLHIQKEGRFE